MGSPSRAAWSMSPNGFNSTRSDYKQRCLASRSALAQLVRAPGGTPHARKGGTTVCKWIVTLLAAASFWVAACADAKLVTWTLRDVTFNDGGTASGFFTFDPIIVPSHDLRTRYLSDFSIKTTAGTTMTAPF